MIFSSATFFVFFIAVMAIYALARTTSQRAMILLVASLIFYASWKPIYLVLLGASLGVNYLLYNRLLAAPRRSVLSFGIAINLLALGLFKYLGMLLGTFLSVASALDPAVDPRVPTWVNWALPLGISFYTFHMPVSYTHLDVYKRQM